MEVQRGRDRQVSGGLYRPTEMLNGGAERIVGECPRASAFPVFHRLRPCFALSEVAGEIGEISVRCVPVQLLDRVCNREVESTALAREHRGVDRLARERVTKGKAVGRFLDDQLGGDQLADQGEHAFLAVAGEHP